MMEIDQHDVGKYQRRCVVCHEFKHQREFHFRGRKFRRCRKCRRISTKHKWDRTVAGRKYHKEYWEINKDRYNKPKKGQQSKVAVKRMAQEVLPL